MIDNSLKTQAFKLKGRFYALTVLKLLDTDMKQIEHQIIDVVSSAPKLFQQTPIVLDCSQLTLESFDLNAICQIMRDYGMVPIAVQGATALMQTMSQSAGLAVLHTSSHQDKLHIPSDEQMTPVVASSTELKSKLISMPVRSGQQVVSKGGDLIITSSVSHGAELLADGHIHVYGALRGRALAGIAGDKSARIFCQSLDAELVSIAGFYRLRDAIEPINRPCQIYLQDEHIQIEPL